MTVSKSNEPRVRVSKHGASRIESGHPWIFSSDVLDRGSAQPGDAVRIVDPRGDSLGVGHFSATSQITLRLLSRDGVAVDRDFYRERLEAAIAFRKAKVRQSDAYRLVHGEGDLLPGLVVDRYGDYLSAQTLSQGMDRAWPVILDCLRELVSPKGIMLRNDVAVRKHESLPLEALVADGDIPACVPIRMNGLLMQADLKDGQKTGVFLDQRENYLAAARHAYGRALDCFTSTGGFALHMASERCESVEAVDSSTQALETARANAEANGIGNITLRGGDVFDVLSAYSRTRAQFDSIVLDPPAFAKSRTAVEGALRGYKDINLRALRLLGRGGILVTCSCSFHVSEADFLGVVAEAALDARRTLRVIERRTQSIDHPILLTVPETHYLKCLVLEVL